MQTKVEKDRENIHENNIDLLSVWFNFKVQKIPDIGSCFRPVDVDITAFLSCIHKNLMYTVYVKLMRGW